MGRLGRSAVHSFGLEAHGTHDYSKALTLLKIAGWLGADDAAGLVGVMYLFGQGTAVDGAEAEKWLLKAAEAGITSAQTILGTMYAQGIAVPRNIAMAKLWLTKATVAGDKEAGSMLRKIEGNGTKVF